MGLILGSFNLVKYQGNNPKRRIARHGYYTEQEYAWALDNQGEVYEAKLGDDMRSYHGYRLREDERAMREWVVKEWKDREV